MKNKAYYYKKDVVKRSKMYGTTTYKLTVYGIKSGKLYRVGETEYNSGIETRRSVSVQTPFLVLPIIRPLYASNQDPGKL